MREENAPSCHQRRTIWTRGNIVLSALVWTVVVLAVFAWSHREAIAAWITALR